MKSLDYKKALGLNINSKNLMSLLKTKTINNVRVYECYEYTETELLDFCNAIGESYYPIYNSYKDAIDILKDYNGIEFMYVYVMFINTQQESEIKEALKSGFINALDECSLKCSITEDVDGFFVFPNGAKELDDALVSEPLEWIKEYPETRKEMAAALKAYSEATPETAYKVADDFRTTLERFFQNYFGAADRSLENFKDDLGTHLKNNGVPSEIRNIMIKNFELYTKYMNNYAKHTNKAKINVLEFIMYQTGIIIRTVITIGKED